MSMGNHAQVSHKPYETPQVVRLGSFVELTRNQAGSGESRQGGNNGCNGNGGPIGC